MPTIRGYCRVSHEDSSESGLGVEAGLFSLATWWKYQQEAGRFPEYTWGTKGWRGERVEPKVKGAVRPRSLISKFDRGQETGDGIFVDEAVSAYKVRLLHRPAGARLAALQQPGDMVVFPRLDRAFRGVSDFAVTVDRWMKAGILVQFVNPQVDLTTAYGMAFAQIAAVFAQLESAIKSERLKEAQARGREQGRRMGKHVSFGWKAAANGEGMIPDEEERYEIARLVELRAAGHSFATIADMLELELAIRHCRQPWPRAPNLGSVNRKWDANRAYKAFKARKRVPQPSEVELGQVLLH